MESIGIYIEGMDMPKSDEFVTVYSNGTVLKEKVIKKEDLTQFLYIGTANAADIAEHGDLIDRDVLMGVFSILELLDSNEDAMSTLDGMPTIIPAG